MAHVCARAPQLCELDLNLPVGFPDDPRGRVVDLMQREPTDRPRRTGVDAVIGWMDLDDDVDVVPFPGPSVRVQAVTSMCLCLLCMYSSAAR